MPVPDVDGPHVPQSSLKEIALRLSNRKRVALLDIGIGVYLETSEKQQLYVTKRIDIGGAVSRNTR